MITILLPLLIISIVFKDLIVHAEFYLNRSFIAATLCVNRDKPASKCNGKCYLKKSIKETQDQKKQNPNPIEEKKTNVLFPHLNESHLSPVLIGRNGKKMICILSGVYSFSYLAEVFHPPQLTSVA